MDDGPGNHQTRLRRTHAQSCSPLYKTKKAGLFVQDKEINWVSKVIVAQKPPRLTTPSTHGRLMGVGS